MNDPGKRTVYNDSEESSDDEADIEKQKSNYSKRYKKATTNDNNTTSTPTQGMENAAPSATSSKTRTATLDTKASHLPPRNDYEDTESDTDFWLKEDYYNEDLCPFVPRYAVCCLNCQCSRDKVMRFVDQTTGVRVLNNCGNSSQSLEEKQGNRYLYHKGCCHNFKVTDSDYQSPMQLAIWNSADQKKIDKYNESKVAEARPLSDLLRSLKAARRKQVSQNNLEENIPEELKEEQKDLEMFKLETSLDFMKIKRDFKKRIEQKTINHSVVVLDLFAGIGSAAVVLKKLGLPIRRIVHVEHDPVANYVSQFNHKNDDIDHIYIETFEEVYGEGDEHACDPKSLGSFVKEYGPFDLVVAGAPCQNYSEVNAFCDREKQNAKYLLQVGTLIKAINEEQQSSVLFMSENVVFRNYDDIMRKYSDFTENGLPPVKIDAQDFSPMVRNRFYWTNMPPDTLENIDAKHRATPHNLLDEGWIMAATAYASMEEIECMAFKANTSMASKSRIDDMRMMKIREVSFGKFIKSSYSVSEREKMMGLPVGYVSNPMKELFRQLTINGFYLPETEEGTTYKTWLDPSLWHFVKQCQFRVKNKIGESPYFQIEISAPREGRKQISFYDEEEYSKRLIGNGWSIVVVEHILKGIKEMYPSTTQFRSYQGFDYNFPWPPFNEGQEQTSSFHEDPTGSDGTNEDNTRNIDSTDDNSVSTTSTKNDAMGTTTYAVFDYSKVLSQEEDSSSDESDDGWT